jgi:hypothetical protein
MVKKMSEDYLEALERIEADQDGLNAEGPGAESTQESEAEQMAASAQGPKLRGDGRPIGTDRWGREKPLTESQEAFLQGVIEGKPLRQAYKDAYPNAQSNEATIAASAWRLSKDPRIERRIIEAWGQTQEALTEDLIAVRRYVMRSLVALSKDANQEGSKIKALELLGRAAGMWRDQMQAQEKPLTAAELKAQLAGHLRLVSDARTKRVNQPAQRVNEDG